MKTDFNYNEDLIKDLFAEGAPYLLRLENGEDAKAIARELYMDKMGVEKDRAISAVSDVQNYIHAYKNDMNAIRSDAIGWVKNKLRDSVDCFDTAKERCEYLHRINVALVAYEILLNGEENAEQKAESFVQNNLSFSYSELEAKALEDAFVDDIAEKFCESEFLAEQLEDILIEVESCDDDELASIAKDNEELREGQRLILSTLAYCKMKNHEFGDLNRFTSDKDMVYAICACLDIEGVAVGLQRGKEINIDAFRPMLKVIGVILAATFFIALLPLVGVGLSMMAVASMINFVFVLVALLAVLLLEWWAISNDAISEVGDFFEKAGEMIDRFVSGIATKLVTVHNKLLQRRNKSSTDVSDSRKVFLHEKLADIKKLPIESQPAEDDIVFTPNYYDDNAKA